MKLGVLSSILNSSRGFDLRILGLVRGFRSFRSRFRSSRGFDSRVSGFDCGDSGVVLGFMRRSTAVFMAVNGGQTA